jgi:putative membrane protein
VSRDRWALACLVALAAWWALLAVAPKYRATWLHENLLIFAGVPFLVWLDRRVRFDRASLALLTLFLALHLVGAHYSYSEVPLLAGPGRNHYDRVVHFAYGLLLAHPIREMFRRVASVRGLWSYALPLMLVMATSMAYEIVEWLFTLVAAPDEGMSFLGTQGDEWDAQKDMALATLGALLAVLVLLLRRK